MTWLAKSSSFGCKAYLTGIPAGRFNWIRSDWGAFIMSSQETSDGVAAADAPDVNTLAPADRDPVGDEELDDATAWDHLDRFNGDVARHE